MVVPTEVLWAKKWDIVGVFLVPRNNKGDAQIDYIAMALQAPPVQTTNIIPSGTVFLTIQKDAVAPNIRFTERNIGHLKPGMVSDAPVTSL